MILSPGGIEDHSGSARLSCIEICGFAQDFPTSKPESVGLSSERLRANRNQPCQHDIDDKRIAGAVTLVSATATWPGSRRRA